VAKFKRDEQRSFGFIWLLTGGLFAVLSAWAVYDNQVTRAPWQKEQKEFFQVELDQANRNLQRTQNVFKSRKDYDGGTKTGAEKVAELEGQQKALKGTQGQEPYAGAAREVKDLTEKYEAAEQTVTFAKSDLDEAYYYRTLGDYERDEAEGKARTKIESALGKNGQVIADKAFADPVGATKASECPPRLKTVDDCADLLHIENEINRNKLHAKGARDALKEFPNGTTELEAAAKKADEVVAKLETERGHQVRIDKAKAALLEIDDKRAVAKAKMAATDSKLDEIERDIAKIKRPVDDAERRLATAKDRAQPKFDVTKLIDSLVGVYEIQQLVTNWNGKMQVDRCTTCHMGVDSSNYADLTVPRKFRTHPMRSQLFATHPVEKFGCTSCHQGQGRATEATFAHSVWKNFDHNGESRWELTGDEFWEDPMLGIGELHRVVVDDRNDNIDVDVAGRFVTLAIPHMEYQKESEFLGAIQTLVQAEVQKAPALARDFRARVVRVDNRVKIGLEAITPEGEVIAKKPVMKVRFKKPELAEVLGFVKGSHVAGSAYDTQGVLKCVTWCTATHSPSVPIRNDDALQAETGYVPPTGKNGLQIPVGYRDRFIESLPATQSGCLKCHAGDDDLRPHKSKAQWILANREKQAREVQIAACKVSSAKPCDPKDTACVAKAEECTKLMTAEPIDLGEDPDKLADLAPTAVEGRNLFKRLNCTGCHILDGFPGNRNAGPSLNAISAKVSPKWLLQWIRYPRAWRSKTRMPAIWPIPVDPETKRAYPTSSAEYAKWETKMKAETLAISAFLWERSEHPELQTISVSAKEPPAVMPAPQKALRETVEADYAPSVLAGLGSTAEEGEKIFETTGCRGCHAIGDDEAEPWKMRERDIAPNLGGVGNKMSTAWMAYWIENPSRYWHGTRMPNLRLTKAEAGSIAMFLANQKTEAKNPAGVGDEEIKRLSDPTERKKLSTEGAALVANYGCFGCHQIAGYEAYAPIAPELNGFSHKDTHTLDYGYAITDHHQKTWETFVVWKLDSPRIWRTDRIELRMADFDLSPREIRALTVFLKGLSEEEIRPDLKPEEHADYKAMMEGRNLVEEYNCRGCHLIEGLGNDIQATIKKREYGLQHTDGELSKQFGPPSLAAEGLRVQPEWLYSFIKDPGANPIRPFLHPETVWEPGKIPDDKRAVRMPTFPIESKDISLIVKYFAAWDGQDYPYQTPETKPLSNNQKLSVLAHMNSNEDGGVRCVQCHYAGTLSKERAAADWKALAPNFGTVAKRLRPAWVKAWVGNPGEFIPYTKMPALWTDTKGDAAPYGPAKTWTEPVSVPYASADDQIGAFRDFLYTLAPTSEFPPAGAETTSPLVGYVAPEGEKPKEGEKKGEKKDEKKGEKKPEKKDEKKPK